jgi:hypothetical protein
METKQQVGIWASMDVIMVGHVLTSTAHNLVF